MEFRGCEEAKESPNRNEESKMESERPIFSCGAEPEDSEFKPAHTQPKDGAIAPKPSDVRNGDLVSLLLAATPPYLYNIPLVPQTFFFSEMLKSFVQAKTERQNLKAQQNHHRRQRKRSWREATPPKTMSYESRDKPLELTTTKQVDDKMKLGDKIPIKKFHSETSEKKFPSPELGNSNFSVEKLANSSITSGSESNNANVTSNDVLPPAPPLWYPLLYPPHPPYGIDPLHFFIDLRVSAHFWDRKLAEEKINNEESGLTSPPLNLHADPDTLPSEPPIGRSRHNSAFQVPAARKEPSPISKNTSKKNFQNVHYVISSLKNIYKALDEREKKQEEKEDVEPKPETNSEKEAETEPEPEEKKKCKDLRALIGLELVVDYVKQESDEEDEKPDVSNPETETQQLVTEK